MIATILNATSSQEAFSLLILTFLTLQAQEAKETAWLGLWDLPGGLSRLSFQPKPTPSPRGSFLFSAD